jgi:hypothetical protein
MRAVLLMTAALALLPVAKADQSACAGVERCKVVDDSDPRLQGANGIYIPADGQIYLSRQATQKGDCAQYLREHEQYHRKQNREGRLVGNEWAESEASQNAPVYNCASDGPRGSLSTYER